MHLPELSVLGTLVLQLLFLSLRQRGPLLRAVGEEVKESETAIELNVVINK